MTNLEGWQKKFIVINGKDLSYLATEECEMLKQLLDKINREKFWDFKQINHQYLVINTDELYADKVIEIMKQHGHWG